MTADERYAFMGLFMFVLFIVFPVVGAVLDLRYEKKQSDDR